MGSPPPARPAWWVLSDVLSSLGATTSYYLAREVFDAIAAARGEFADMTYDMLGFKGRLLAGAEQPAGAVR